MTKYLFEFIEDGHTQRCTVLAYDSLDAFDMFRASFLNVTISNIWVDAFKVAA